MASEFPTPANADQAAEQEVIAFNQNTVTEADFESLCKGFYMYTTQSVHVAFDEAANSGSFLLTNAMGFVSFDQITATRVSALGDSTTGNLYIIGRR